MRDRSVRPVSRPRALGPRSAHPRGACAAHSADFRALEEGVHGCAAVRPFVANGYSSYGRLRARAPLRSVPARGTASVGQHARRCRRSEVPTVGGADGRSRRRSEVPTFAAVANGAYSRAARRRATCGQPYTVHRTWWRRKCSGRHAPPRSESADLRVVGGGCRGHQAERCLTGTVTSVTDLSGAGLSGTPPSGTGPSGTCTHTHTHTHTCAHTRSILCFGAQQPSRTIEGSITLTPIIRTLGDNLCP